jgi:hypothetical protein
MKFKYLHIISSILIAFISLQCQQSSDSLAGTGANGVGGSLARFAITGNTLYSVTQTKLNVLDVADAQNPQFKKEQSLGFGIETIFPYQNYLFIGTQTGLQIFDNQNPLDPKFVSSYSHLQSCDPVVVQGNYAYVTLRGGTPCRSGINQLEVIDITDIKNPKVIKIYYLQNPHGLGIDGNRLFVCEGDYGLKIYDISKPDTPIEKYFLKDVKSYDVIPQNNVLIVTGKDGIYQYDYSNQSELKLLSKILVEK